MAQVSAELSTGLPGLDKVLKGLIPGDNLVWQVESVDDYRPFVQPYAQTARRRSYVCDYFRFGQHAPLLEEQEGVRLRRLHPERGVEAFLAEVHRVIEATGPGGFYVFDCLSDLAGEWYSDQMLANFFLLTCPYLFDVNALAYFGLLRHSHSLHTLSTIANTAQILVDVYRHDGHLFVHPWKVQARYSPTMHMLHAWEGEEFRPVTQSATIAEILTPLPWLRQETVSYPMGVWPRTFQEAQAALRRIERGESDVQQERQIVDRLLRMVVSRDERVLKLAEQYMRLADLLDIGKRMIGTGLIGGKSVGMLLARAILRAKAPRLDRLMERHDSFYIGSDVFYTFLVHNGLWWTRDRQRSPGSMLEGAEQARRRMLTGTFPEHIYRQFEDLLDYFGQSPFIVRSSSLLEDNFGNAFAGKYESVFCVNQAPRHRRLDDFVSAVRTIYASSMSQQALTYRARRGLLDLDEQMALLVQRVSGATYGRQQYYPQVAGVGFSVNPYVWSDQIDPKAGVLRLVFGLGTRAVDRRDDDYTRLVALNAPQRRPEATFDTIRRYSQRKVDVLDLEANQLTAVDFPTVVRAAVDLPIDLFASRDPETLRRAAQHGIEDTCAWALTFDKLFAETDFVSDMRQVLRVLHEAYDYPVDVEFTANFLPDGAYRIDLLQCRPLQIKEGGRIVDPPEGLSAADTLLRARGAVLGRSRLSTIDRVICVLPERYAGLAVADRYALARLLGRLTRADEPAGAPAVLLIGPGRWGTTTPSLGVPVQFADISTVSALCEVVAMGENVVPDVSLGTHFLSDLVEMDILYFALFPGRQENGLNLAALAAAPNRLPELVPDASKWSEAVRVVAASDLAGRGSLKINANVLSQQVICYVERGPSEACGEKTPASGLPCPDARP